MSQRELKRIEVRRLCQRDPTTVNPLFVGLLNRPVVPRK